MLILYTIDHGERMSLRSLKELADYIALLEAKHYCFFCSKRLIVFSDDINYCVGYCKNCNKFRINLVWYIDGAPVACIDTIDENGKIIETRAGKLKLR